MKIEIVLGEGASSIKLDGIDVSSQCVAGVGRYQTRQGPNPHDVCPERAVHRRRCRLAH